MVDIKQIKSFLGTSQNEKRQLKNEIHQETKANDTLEEINVQENKNTQDLELIAVITAAICASMNVSKDEFIVRSIKRRKQQV